MSWTVYQPDVRHLPTHRKTPHEKTRTYIHASRGIRNRDPSVPAVEDSRCLRLRGQWDRHQRKYKQIYGA